MAKEGVCYSGAAAAGVRHNLGSPHYSYRFAEEKFLSCLAELDLGTRFLSMPECYSAPKAYEDLPTIAGRHVHMIFRSSESIRLLKDAVNIVCFAWEFPHLKQTAADGEHPFGNQKRMLGLCDEIWVPCSYTRTVLEDHGLDRVHFIPAPIRYRQDERLSKHEALARIGHINSKQLFFNFLRTHRSARSQDLVPLFTAVLGQTRSLENKSIFLSVLNPEDFRKNIDAMIRGFDRHVQRDPDAVLIIKALTSVDRFELNQVVNDVFANKLAAGSTFATENIIVFNDYLLEDEMTALYDLADFYLCTSIAEGQNLPLLEAMARGVVPVTTKNTAMLDYIDNDNAVIIATDRVLNTCEHLAGNLAGKPYDVDLCNAKQVADALGRAAALSDGDYDALSRAASAIVRERYCVEVVSPMVEERLRSVGRAIPR